MTVCSEWRHFTVSVGKQEHQTVETSVRHLGDVGGAPADGLNGGRRKRLVLTLHVGLKKDSERKDGTGAKLDRRGRTTNMVAPQRPVGDCKDVLSILYAVSVDVRQTWNSLRIVEMLASLARLVRISSYENHKERGLSETLSLINVRQTCRMNCVWIKCVENILNETIYE